MDESMDSRRHSGRSAGPSGMEPQSAGVKKAAKRRGNAARASLQFRRGQAINTKEIGDLKLKGKLKRANKLAEDAAAAAGSVHEWLRPADSGYLEAEGMERTWRFKQDEIKDAVEVGAARKAFDLRLPDLGPYQMDFDRSGRFMALAGAKGHLAMMDWQRSQLVTEIQVKEAARAVQFLHNHLFFAVAQRKHCYIYDKRGLEVHCLREHLNTNALAFLPHHFLLASVGDYGVLRYLDTTTGQLIAQHKTHLGPCSVMRRNPWNAVLALGHGNGRTTMWTPNLTKPVVSLLCHRSPVSALAIDVQGRHMVTAGVDKQVHVWDLRNTFRRLHSYLAFAPPCALDISQKGMLAVGYGSMVQVWADALSRKQASPYMTHRAPLGTLESLRFCPFEDVLGIGAAAGVSTMLVPGSGEPCYDSFVADPFQTKSQRREQEVAHLLDKLQPDMIVLDPTAIAQVAREPLQVQKERRQEQDMVNEERAKAQREKNEAKTRMKGKNKPSKRYRKKQLNVIDDKRAKVLERMRVEGKRTAEHGGKGSKDGAGERGGGASVPRALQTFVRR